MVILSGALIILGLISAAAFVIGVPLVFGLLAWDIVSRIRGERVASPVTAEARGEAHAATSPDLIGVPSAAELATAEIHYVAPASVTPHTDRISA